MTQLFTQALTLTAHVGVHVGASIGNWPLWLDINGLLLVGLFTVQALAGYRIIKLKRTQFLALHSTVAWLIVVTASLHAILATIHLAIG